MKRRDTSTGIIPRMVTREEGAIYTGMGLTNFTKWARGIGSERHFGSSVRFDRVVIDAVLDAMTAGNGSGSAAE